MQIESRGIVGASKSYKSQQSKAFPSICVLPNGRWMCGFRSAPTKEGTVGQKAMITWSDDEGESWHEPNAPFVPPNINSRPGLFRSACLTALGGNNTLATLCWVDHSEPSLPFFNEQTQGLLDTEIFFSLSENNGVNWSKPWPMDTTPFKQPTAITGPVIILDNEDWACQFELNKPYYDTSEWHHSSVMMFSKDRGKTWPEHAIVSRDPANRIFYWDQRPALVQNRTILNFFWTYDSQAAVYLNIHGNESHDNGSTWSAMWDTGVPGQPAAPVALHDGRISMVYVDRTCEPMLKMRISKDNGKTWPKETEIIIYETNLESQTWDKESMQDAWAEMGKFSMGLPATDVMQNGDVLVVYYAGAHTDRTEIQWASIKCH